MGWLHTDTMTPIRDRISSLFESLIEAIGMMDVFTVLAIDLKQCRWSWGIHIPPLSKIFLGKIEAKFGQK